MCKPLFLLLAFFSCRLVSFGQDTRIDSLNAIIKTAAADTSVAAAYVALTEIFYATDPDTVIPLCNKALDVVEKNIGNANDREKHALLLSKADALNNIGAIFMQRGKMNEALDYFNQVLAVYEETATPERAPIILNNIGVIYYKQGKTEKSLDYYHRSLKMRGQLGDSAGVAQSLSNIGVIYNIQGQTDKALEYFQQSLDIRRRLGDQQGMAFSLNNLGAVHRSLGRMEKARSYYDECLEIYTASDNKEGMANTYHNIGSTYEDSQPEKAMAYFNLSLPIYEKTGNRQGIANSSISMARVLMKLGRPEEALKSGNRSLQTAQEGGYAETIRNAHFVLSGVDSALGNTAGAFAHYKQYVFYRDSIANEATRKAGIEKHAQYEFDKKEALLKAEQDEKLKRQELINWFTGVSSGLFLLFVVVVFNRYRLKQKHLYQQKLNAQQKAQAVAVMETQEQERKRIAEDLHDSLGHLLSTAKLNLQAFPESQRHLVENPLLLLNQASHEIRNITFNLMPRTLEEEGLVPALNELAKKTTSSGIRMSLHVHGMENVALEMQAQFNIYRIVQEAVNNILKHAQARAIGIQLVRADGQLTVMVEDDGKGFDPASLKKNGRGLKNITTRSEWLNGKTGIDSTPGRGTTIAIEIPLKA